MRARAIHARLAGAFALGVVAAASAPPMSFAQTRAGVCHEARDSLARAPELALQIATAFGAPNFAAQGEENCIYPVKSIDYRDALVLITSAGAPGAACHACAAQLSAAVLRRAGARLVLARRFDDFAQAGSFGNPGEITRIELSGDDGFVIASGGTWQGQSFLSADVFVFRRGRLVQLKAEPALQLEYSNAGYVDSKRKEITVGAKWRVAGAAIHVTWDVSARGRRRAVEAVWRDEGASLRLVEGRVPPELLESR